MKYYIEFELPDNDVVLERIEHEWVKWGVWGYSGYAYAKPVACEKPDLSTMLFSERKELADKYEQWAKKNCVEDCALSVISYLCAFGYIPTLFNWERKTGRWIQDESGDYKCSECGGREDRFIYGREIWYGNGESNFCPNCGARMDGVRNGIVINKNLCDSCITKGCIFQSGIVRSHCDFYNAKGEKNSGADIRGDQDG